jgi:fatty acid desaturase
MKPSDLQGWFQAGGHLVIFATTGLMVAYFFSKQNWILFLIALFCHGTVGSFFRGIGPHELAHGTVFKTKKLNKLFLKIYSILGWWNFYDYAMSHTYHHRYTLYDRGDREVVLPREPSLKSFYLLQLFTFNIFGGSESAGFLPVVKQFCLTAVGKFHLEWIRDLYQGESEEHQRSVKWARLVLLFHLSIVVIAVIFELWALVIIISLHIFIGNWLRYFVGQPMHCGLRSNVADFRKCARTIKLDPLSEFLYWRMNWHLEHHMYAGVPCYNLKKLHRLLAADMPEPRTLIGAWREMRETWHQQQIDPGYEYDTPVPMSLNRGDETDGSLAESIGELAPNVLRT